MKPVCRRVASAGGAQAPALLEPARDKREQRGRPECYACGGSAVLIASITGRVGQVCVLLERGDSPGDRQST